jgi:hypothetical protein
VHCQVAVVQRHLNEFAPARDGLHRSPHDVPGQGLAIARRDVWRREFGVQNLFAYEMRADGSDYGFNFR